MVSRIPRLKDLSSLSYAELKKISNAYEIFALGFEEYQAERVRVNAINTDIEQQNKRTQDRENQWHKQRLDPLHAEIRRVAQALYKCRVGFFSQLVTDSFSDGFERYKIMPGRNLVKQREELLKKLKAVEESEPEFALVAEEYLQVRFPKNEMRLKIGGVMLCVELDKVDIRELNGLINRYEQQKAKVKEQQAKLIEQRAKEKEIVTELRARVRVSDSETREAAKKFKRDLHKQVAKWPCCPYCMDALDDQNANLDHIYPVSKGGRSTAKNLVFVCRKCTQKKTNLTLRAVLVKFQIDDSIVHECLELLEKDF
jgi:5-methylcytosine-specific restriction endonuclease McrA